MQDFDSKWLPFHNSFTYYLYSQPNKVKFSTLKSFVLKHTRSSLQKLNKILTIFNLQNRVNTKASPGVKCLWKCKVSSFAPAHSDQSCYYARRVILLRCQFLLTYIVALALFMAMSSAHWVQVEPGLSFARPIKKTIPKGHILST